MTKTEARLAAALKAELDTIEPSPASWDVIREGRVVPRRWHAWRPLALAAAMVAAAAIVIAAVVTATPPDGGQVTDVAPAEPQSEAGLVVDETGDASAPHLDLESARVRVVGDDVQITWTLAGPVPASGPVDYRIALTDSAEGGEPIVVVVRIEDETRVAVGRCGPGPSGTADCTGRRLPILTTQPQVDGDTVSLTLPRSAIEIPVDRLEWTAYVQEIP